MGGPRVFSGSEWPDDETFASSRAQGVADRALTGGLRCNRRTRPRTWSLIRPLTPDGVMQLEEYGFCKKGA